MNEKWLLFAGFIAACFIAAWTLAAVAADISRRRDREPPALADWIYQELRPLYLPAACLAFNNLANDGLQAIDIFYIIIVIVGYLTDRGDDGRWRRRIKRLTEHVERSGSRLAVVTTRDQP